MNEINISEKVTDILYNAIKKTNTYENAESLIVYASTFVFVTTILSTLTLTKLNKFNNERNTNVYDIDIEILKINKKLDKIAETNEEIILFMNNSKKTANISIDNNIEETKSIEIETNKVGKLSIIDEDELINECYDNIPCSNLKKITSNKNLFNWK